MNFPSWSNDFITFFNVSKPGNFFFFVFFGIVFLKLIEQLRFGKEKFEFERLSFLAFINFKLFRNQDPGTFDKKSNNFSRQNNLEIYRRGRGKGRRGKG